MDAVEFEVEQLPDAHPGYDASQFEVAVALFEEVALTDVYDEFLTLPAYESMP